MTKTCRLCEKTELKTIFHRARPGVRYWHCASCDLIFIDPEFLLSFKDEKARYENHENISDKGYEKFLGQLWEPFRQILLASKSAIKQKGLDFGCGPGPVLQKIIQQNGFECAVYDPYYAMDENVLQNKYDFVTCTEVVEHFNHPQKSWQQLLSLVKPGGFLGVMTQFHKQGEAEEFFENWWYARDPAHISFYSEKTFRWIFSQVGFEILQIQSPIVIAQKFI